MDRETKDLIIKLFYIISITSSQSKSIDYTKIKRVGLRREIDLEETRTDSGKLYYKCNEYWSYKKTRLPEYVVRIEDAMLWYVENVYDRSVKC